MSLLAMNSLMYNEEGQWPVPLVRRKNIHAVCCEGNYFPKRKLKLFNSSLFHSVYLLFSIRLFSIANLFSVRYLWDVCNDDKCCVVTHHPADNRVAWLVYVRKYGLPIATFNQNKRSRLLYLGDAQIISTAVDLDVGYNGAEFNCVCCK